MLLIKIKIRFGVHSASDENIQQKQSPITCTYVCLTLTETMPFYYRYYIWLHYPYIAVYTASYLIASLLHIQ